MRVPSVALHTTLETILKQGRGCMDPADTTDAYRFSLSGMQGTNVELESDNATNMD